MLHERRILLVIGGGIAAYKCLDLIRRLKERGATVRVILTEAAKQFVTPLSVGALSGERVFGDLFDLTAEHDIGHIQLSREADLIVVAPATADLMAKAANGFADDLASTALLATDKPVLMAPAMNPRMWSHPATRRNAARLKEDGVGFVGPNSGAMAERGEFGEGRMAEPMEILAAIEARFGEDIALLKGRRILITSGPTHEPIDPVRYIANRSSGKQGHAIAAAAAAAGAEVVLVAGPVDLPDPRGVKVLHVESAREMLAAVEENLPVDAAVFAAAVADWRVASEADQKIKKQAGQSVPALALVENPDILALVSRHSTLRPRLVVGFAAETQNVVPNARAKRARKGCDWIVANDVSPATGVMGGDVNTVHLVSEDGVEDWPSATKTEVARRLVARIAGDLAGKGGGA
ncbi:bifunctional phosphopantothenoylcysteine decarboxylase/phosphopantothenate--cysteine ligase CoaBC [Aquabacter cavernae]|uniref:bifunctional phosphopantothenoylcysteine decarboxylase/phosphopantothenate--cysteine ligase CoaBC n=1 Tax=Aquabacter cavernae TaxID=2496029 RepID=UPI000F8E5AEA|nr:bifunctional phosphopantothenoylcysteine decarboxylase/phosphopantothenate--cysteine ligase CoaBC [Aquabacter cavernae]